MDADWLKSYAFVAVQALALAAIAFTGPIFAPHPGLLAVELIGVGLGLWGIWSMGLGNFWVTPAITLGGRFVDRGPYRYIRHPMYASLLLITLALVLSHFSLLRLGFWGILLLDLWLKLSFEEARLVEHFAEYSEYRRRTHRLVPFLI